MKILIVSIPTHEGRVSDNIQRAIDCIRRQLDCEHADVALLGELFTCGYCARDLAPYGEPADGASVQAMAALARETECMIGFGFAETDRGQVYNSYALIEPGQAPFIYRKTHLHLSAQGRIENEPEYLSAGDRLGLIETRWGKLGLMICFDGSIAEVARELALQGALAVLWPARSGGVLAGRGVVPIRAIDNVMPMILAENPQVGSFYPNQAHSLICDQSGKVIGELRGAGCLRAEIDLSGIEALRRSGTGQAGVFQGRRPELYQSLVK